MKYELKPLPVLGHLLPGAYGLILVTLCVWLSGWAATRQALFAFLRGCLGSTSQSVVVLVIAFLAASILGLIVDAFRNGIWETVADKCIWQNDETWWDMFFNIDKDKIEQINDTGRVLPCALRSLNSSISCIKRSLTKAFGEKNLKIVVIVFRLIFILCGLELCFAGDASATCEKKSQLIDRLVSRLHDLAYTSDDDQGMRDADAIRQIAYDIGNEDCVHASAEIVRFVQFSTTLAVRLSASSDYGQADRPMLLMSIQEKVYFSSERQDSADCRCYARKQTLSDIFQEVQLLLDDYGSIRMTSREADAVLSWFKILNQYLSYTAGLRIQQSGNNIIEVNVRRAFNEAQSQLRKHCNLSIYGKATYPGDCKFHEFVSPSQSTSPAPDPSPSV